MREILKAAKSFAFLSLKESDGKLSIRSDPINFSVYMNWASASGDWIPSYRLPLKRCRTSSGGNDWQADLPAMSSGRVP